VVQDKEEARCNALASRLVRLIQFMALLLMYHDLSAADNRGWVGTIHCVYLVVVDDVVRRVLIPDFDAELVGGAINGREHEAEAASAVDGASTFVHRLSPGNHQPVVVV